MTDVDKILRQNEQRIIFDKVNATGSDEIDVRVLTGSRMLVTLSVTAIDPATTITLDLSDTISADDAYQGIAPGVSATAIGQYKRVYSDFNVLVRARVNVVGGNATYKVNVVLFDNASTTRIENAQLSVDLDARPDSLGHYDSIRIGDGVDELEINPDGSINVNDDIAVDETPVNPYGESPALATGVEVSVVTYVVPVGKIAFLYRAEAGGENIARFRVAVNGDVIATRRTFHGRLATNFEFGTPVKRAVVLHPGDTIEVKAIHNRPDVGDFEARLQLLLKDA